MLISLVSPCIEPSEVNIVTGQLTSTLGCNLLSLPSILISLSCGIALTRMFHESLTTTTDVAVLPGVLGCWPLRRTIQVRLGINILRLPGGMPIFVVS